MGLPSLIQDLVGRMSLKIHIGTTDAHWSGITNPGDVSAVESHIGELIKNGEYGQTL
jgi:hypothetical protein